MDCMRYIGRLDAELNTAVWVQVACQIAHRRLSQPEWQQFDHGETYQEAYHKFVY